MATRKGFLDLPPEIRNKIYRFLVSPDLPEASKLGTSRSCPLGSVAASTKYDISIIHTNRQIYNEASDIFYRDHLFVCFRFSFSGVAHGIHNLGLHETIRKNTASCPLMVMVVNVDLADDAAKAEDAPVDIVLACHDLPLLADLLLYVYQRNSHKKGKKNEMNLRLQIHNKINASAAVINQRLLVPMRDMVGIESAVIELCEEAPPGLAFMEDSEQFLIPYEYSEDHVFIMAQRSLARLLEHYGRWADTFATISVALRFVDLFINNASGRTDSNTPMLTWFLRCRFELLVYVISLGIRLGFEDQNSLDRLADYCAAFNNVQPTTKLLPLCQSIKSYLRFTRSFYQEGMVSPTLIQAALDHDPKDELELGTREMLKAVESGDPSSAEYNQMIDQVDQSLCLPELDKLLARLYRVAGVQ